MMDYGLRIADDGERFARDVGFVRSYVTRDGMLHLSLQADGGIESCAPVSTGLQ